MADEVKDIPLEQYLELLQRHKDLLASASKTCKYYADAELFNSPSYYTYARNYRKLTEALIAKELKIISTQQTNINFSSTNGKEG